MGTEGSFDFEEESLAAAFSRLSAVKREIITMLFLLNMTPHEIADKLGCTVRTARADEFWATLLRATKGDNEALADIIEMYMPLINSHSYLYGRLDKEYKS